MSIGLREQVKASWKEVEKEELQIPSQISNSRKRDQQQSDNLENPEKRHCSPVHKTIPSFSEAMIRIQEKEATIQQAKDALFALQTAQERFQLAFSSL